jgi:hypothetical protein
MKRHLALTILALSVSGSQLLTGADSVSPRPPSSAKPAEQASIAGKFVGKWKSSKDANGELRIKFTQASATWTAEASFFFEGAEIPSKMKEIQVNGSKVHLVFDWEINNTAGQSKLSGELTGDTLQGTYETSGPAGASEGTWSVKRV